MGRSTPTTESSSARPRQALSRDRLVAQLVELGVEPGGVLLVHTSFRAVRPVEDGPEGLVAALREALDSGGTLVMPSWSNENDLPFDPERSETDPDLGVVARVFWRMEGVRRSNHPFAFAAAGPRAKHILQDPLPLPPHIPGSPVGRVRDLDGQVLLLGVNHDADTTVHLGEIEGGAPYRVPKHCTVRREGRPVRIDYGENDHCCRRFVLVDEWLRSAGAQHEGVVGHATARLARSRDVVEVVVGRLRDDPLVFLHAADEGCADCDEARASVDRPGAGIDPP